MWNQIKFSWINLKYLHILKGISWDITVHWWILCSNRLVAPPCWSTAPLVRSALPRDFNQQRIPGYVILEYLKRDIYTSMEKNECFFKKTFISGASNWTLANYMNCEKYVLFPESDFTSLTFTLVKRSFSHTKKCLVNEISVKINTVAFRITRKYSWGTWVA